MKKLKTCGIIIARQGSKRLPGKALKLIDNKPVLKLICERLESIAEIDEICIATSDLLIDKPIINFAKDNNINYFAGDAEDVLKRLYDAATFLKADFIYEVGGDCPFVDKETFLKGYNLLKKKKLDFVHNFAPMTYPDGLDCPIITYNCLKKVHLNSRLSSHRFHPFSYIFTYKDDFKVMSFTYHEDLSNFRLTLDYEEDFKLIKIIFESLYKSNKNFTLKDIIIFLRNNKSLLDLNNKYILPPVPEGYWNTLSFVNDIHDDIINEISKIKEDIINQNNKKVDKSYKDIIKLLKILMKRSEFMKKQE
jgi:spore coat polysaccharide biosynthesis protein SpsF